MLIARVSFQSEVHFVSVEEEPGGSDLPADARLRVIDTHPFGEITYTGQELLGSQVRLLAPVLPSKIIAVGKNYAEHAKEMGGDVPAEPMIFLKPSTSVIGPNATIELPAMSQQVEHEAELAIVIGRLCKEVPLERVKDVVLGYTCADDVTARDLQRTDGQWGRAKGFDTFCPLGPWINTDLDPGDLAISCDVNGDVRQESRTSEMVRGVPELVSWISTVMTLLPGDVILTGTPAGVSPIVAGDEVAVTIQGIGTLVNTVGG
ncbi:MAG: 2-hydroxyhepta-2,4-diene-1,7-dioate isomerase [Actinomycetales bacterium mxb001]|nr:MAG: 2-hydroxyhepta-2,4-diene-1,7-dioate isomerase [Actinomycetales bacterium mxb001]